MKPTFKQKILGCIRFTFMLFTGYDLANKQWMRRLLGYYWEKKDKWRWFWCFETARKMDMVIPGSINDYEDYRSTCDACNVDCSDRYYED